MRKTMGILVGLLLATSTTWGSWTISQAWNYGNTVYRMKIGDVRGDGHQRLYCGTRDGSVNELSFEQGGWVNRLLDILPAEVYDVAIAAGRNDHIRRLYLPVLDGHLYELSCVNGLWQRTDMGSGGGRMNQVAFGYGRNDNVLRAYATNTDGHFYEFTWSQGRWSQVDLGNIGGWMIDVAVGRTGHDHRVHVYTSSQNGGIYELTYSQGWTSQLVDQLGQPGAPWGMELGKVGTSGDCEIVKDPNSSGSIDCEDLDLYVSSEAERDVWQYRWVGNRWQKTSIGQVGPSSWPIGSDIAIGNGRNDKADRVYQMNKDAHVYEFSCHSGHWATADLGAGATGWATGVTVGPGRDDQVQRVYSCYPDGQVAEYTYQARDVTVNNGSKGSPLQGYPNPFRDKIGFRAAPGIPGNNVLEIFDLEGRLVARVETCGGQNQFIWDGRNADKRPLPAGIYYVRLAGQDSKAIPIVKVR